MDVNLLFMKEGFTFFFIDISIEIKLSAKTSSCGGGGRKEFRQADLHQPQQTHRPGPGMVD